MATDGDLTIAIIIAMLIIIIILCAWPGTARIRGGNLIGHWASPSGTYYEIRSSGSRTFAVFAGKDAASIQGRITGIRGVRLITVPRVERPKRGHVELTSRRIKWTDGDVWTRQGLEGN